MRGRSKLLLRMPNTQEGFNIPESNHLEALAVDQATLLQLLHKSDPVLVPPERIIHGEENPLNLRVAQNTRHGIDAPIPAGSDPQILVVDLLERAGRRRPPHGQLVDAREHEREHFAHVADDQFQVRDPVEQPAREQPQDVRRDI